MTDNQDSVTVGAVQLPTDRPLTAGDVRYVEGHLDMTHALSLGAFIGKSLASHVSGNRMPAMSGDNRERIPAPIRERFDRDCESTAQYILDHLSRPATSAASEGEGVERVAQAVDPKAWNDGLPIPTRADTISFHARRQASIVVARRVLAALASPPVSERERELEGALRVIANASRRSETMFGGKMSDVTRVFVNITRVAESALTAQLAGEGK